MGLWVVNICLVNWNFSNLIQRMSIFKPCGPECPHCDCGRSDNECKFKQAKLNGRKKVIGLTKPSNATDKPKKKESQKDKKKRRKKGRR